MFYTRAFNNSLFISTTFHVCLAIIFFFITFSHHSPIFKTIEISILTLPEKEEPEVLKPEPKIRKQRIPEAIKKRSEPKIKKSPKSIKEPVEPIKPKVVQEVKEMITPIPIPSAPGGMVKDELHKEIPMAKGVVNEGISQTEKGKALQVSSTPPPSSVEIDEEEESTRPYVVTGPAAKRKAVYQPKFNTPYWLEKRGQSLHGKLKIWVLPDGSVDKVEIDESFGYAEVDKLAQSTVYRWRFYKLPPGVTKVDWGIVTIHIRLE